MILLLYYSRVLARIYQSKKYNLQRLLQVQKNLVCKITFLPHLQPKNLFFSPIINYWATFVAQMFNKKTYKTSETPKNLPKKMLKKQKNG